MHTEPLSFSGKLSPQYNTLFTTSLMDFCECDVGVVLGICVVRREPHHMPPLVYVNVFKMFEGFQLFAFFPGSY